MRTNLKVITALVACIAAGILLAACGSSNSSSSSGSTTGESGSSGSNAALIKKSEKILTSAYHGIATEMPKSGPKAVPGKEVWLINCPLTISSCAEISKGFESATAAIGWHGTVLDDGLDPQKAAQFMEKAIAAHVDGIVTGALDCPTVKSALEQVKAAGIPIIGIASQDCEPSLYTGVSTMAGLPWIEGVVKDKAPARAAWGVVATEAKMDVIDVTLKENVGTRTEDEVFKEYISGCSTCDIVDEVALTGATLANTQSLVSAALTAHPEANTIFVYDAAAYPSGVLQAVEQAGRKDMTLIGSECTGGEIKMIHEGYNTNCYGYDVAQAVWQSVDWLNRIFSGESAASLPKTGLALLMIDKEHNLPSGDKFPTPVKFEAGYEHIWGVG
jgi:ribose transport system substrate-binding protein